MGSLPPPTPVDPQDKPCSEKCSPEAAAGRVPCAEYTEGYVRPGMEGFADARTDWYALGVSLRFLMVSAALAVCHGSPLSCDMEVQVGASITPLLWGRDRDCTASQY